MSSTPTYQDWNDIVKKEARGLNDDDLGEVQEVGDRYVVTQKGLISKDRFYIPKNLFSEYDGKKVYFRVTENQAKNNFVREDASTDNDYYDRWKTADTPADIETRIPVVEERLGVSKTATTKEVGIRKEPTSRTERVQVPVEHEEVTVEKRAVADKPTTDTPTTTDQEVRVPLKQEHVQVTKEPRVKEEVVVTKKPVTETKEIEEEVKGERVDTTT